MGQGNDINAFTKIYLEDFETRLRETLQSILAWVASAFSYSNRFFLSNLDRTAWILIVLITLELLFLSFFRFALYDEILFLRETAFMARLLANGEWIGSYGVGVHGFIFKLPVALAFLVTGPSVFVATLFHICLATLSSYIFFLILRDNLYLGKWALVGLALFGTNYSFVSWSITFHRETPLLFALLLLFRSILSKKRSFLIGLSLVLVLDAKEYVFFAIVPAVFLWLLCEQRGARFSVNEAKAFLKRVFWITAPSLVFLFFMFATALVPLNEFAASLLNFTTRGGLDYQLRHISSDNYAMQGQPTDLIHLATKVFESIPFLQEVKVREFALHAVKLGSYMEKVLYLSAFSLQSVSVLTLLPAIMMSVRSFFIWREQKLDLVVLPLFFWIYLAIYMLKISHQRYLYPLVPLSIIFFVIFLMHNHQGKILRKSLTILLVAYVLFIVGLNFYPYNDQDRMLFEVLVGLTFSLLLGLFILYRRQWMLKALFYTCTISGVFLILVGSLFFNQFAKSRTWGINGETRAIANLVLPSDVIYINQTGVTNEAWLYMVQFYRQEPLAPYWKWELKAYLPKAALIKVFCCQKTYTDLQWTTEQDLHALALDYAITKIVIVGSTLENIQFEHQEQLPALLNADWLSVEQTIRLTNKAVYVFQVNSSE